MTDESKALPDWKPEDGCIPDEWLVALRDNRLTEEQGDLVNGHPWCFECMDRYGTLVCDVTGEWLSRAASSEAESQMTWRPEAGCIPIELLLAIHLELFSEETELRLFTHIAECPKCDLRVSYLPAAKPKGPTLFERLRKGARFMSDDARRRILEGESPLPESGLEL
jgi:hypothetical protein